MEEDKQIAWGYRTENVELKHRERELDREGDQGKNPDRVWGAEGGIKNWGQGARQREMEITGNSDGCRKKREELINSDRELDREGQRKAKIAVRYRAERKN